VANPYFKFKAFTIYQPNCPMRVSTEACLFGAWVAAQIKPQPQQTCLDVGTGTGLLTCMLAQQHKLNYTAIELNPLALQDATNNFKQLNFEANIVLQAADFNTYPTDHTFDYIISNPPFYENSLIGQNQNKNMALHAQDLSLVNLLNKIATILTQHATAFILYPFSGLNKIESIANNLGLFISHIVIVHQTEKHDAFRVMVALTKSHEKIITTTLTIKINNQYSEAFKNLLQPYYLIL
jgi:tRNA1Val (adenine37-N6)-methyltransferase